MGLELNFGALLEAAEWVTGPLQPCDELGSFNLTPRKTSMPYDLESSIAMANALALLLHNQHALGAEIE